MAEIETTLEKRAQLKTSLNQLVENNNKDIYAYDVYNMKHSSIYRWFKPPDAR